MNDKKYLDSILQNIHEGEAVQEKTGAGIAILTVASILAYWVGKTALLSLKLTTDKQFRTCLNKEGMQGKKKCVLSSKIFKAERALQIMNKVGPLKCKAKKDPGKCMKKLQVDKSKLQKQLQYLKAQLSVIN